MNAQVPSLAQRDQIWALAVISLAILVAYGAVWTRGINGDDLCFGALANSKAFLEAIRSWVTNVNSRLLSAVTLLGTYRLPWFSDPYRAPWYAIHTLVITAHLFSFALLFRLILRTGTTVSAAFIASLFFAIHPISVQPVLWLAASFGYVFGNLLTILAVWCFLEYERRNKIGFLILSFLLALLAITGIEQYMVVLGVLAGIYFLTSRWRKPPKTAWLPLFLIGILAIIFVLMHFVVFPATNARIDKVAENAATVNEHDAIPWTIAWNLSLVPEASPYAGRFQTGLYTMTSSIWLTALVAITAVAVAWRTAIKSAWKPVTPNRTAGRYLWLGVIGLAIFLAAVLPFYFVGYGGIAPRNLYVALPGFSLMGAALLDILSRSTSLHTALRLVLAPSFAVLVAMCLVINIGAQVYYAENWNIHRSVIRAVEVDAAAIREAKAIELTGLPEAPFAGPSQFDTGWGFPCLVRWITGASDVEAWTNLMSTENVPTRLTKWHCIDWQPEQPFTPPARERKIR